MAKSDDPLDSTPTNRRRPSNREELATAADGSASAAPVQVTFDDRLLPVLDEDRYQDDGELGRGGMGEVQASADRCLGRQVALKRLRPELLDDAQLRARFVREARIQGQLEHPAIVPLYDVGTVDGAPCSCS
ncbi:MAG: hypothetical protein DRI90_06485 [Deltaproteobacteria bacterium]|nr:MAG: hypothetical protein DRI90_06485 [Deltaproteobacteria bacterium]